MKKCPFCAEEIQEEAVKCKHCGEFLIDAELKRLKKDGNIKWYYRTSSVVVSLLLIGPLALPLVWFHPNYNIATKIVVTILVIGLTLGLGIAMIELYAELLKQIETMGV
jgi:predicted nucleic acid-binding Zn ribbon protein